MVEFYLYESVKTGIEFYLIPVMIFTINSLRSYKRIWMR